jgi:hypothetical protein
MSAEKRSEQKKIVYQVLLDFGNKIPLINLGELLRKMEWEDFTPKALHEIKI